MVLTTKVLERQATRTKGDILYEKVAVIGCGSLGGFFADSLVRATKEEIKTLTLIDYNEIEKSNLRNSIYRVDDVGKKKTDVLKKIIKASASDIEIVTIDVEYQERKTMIPDCDLVFDCRDYIYDRYGQIDARLYLSGRHLIIDCRRVVKHDFHYEGNYSDILGKNDLAVAGLLAAKIVSDRLLFEDLVSRQSIFKESIDNYMKGSKKTKDSKPDIIFDCENDDCDKIISFIEIYGEIRDENMKTSIPVYKRSVDNKLSKKIIGKGEISSYNKAKRILESVVSYDFRRYLVFLEKIDGKMTIILLAETGGA